MSDVRSAAVTGWALRTPLGSSLDLVVRRLLGGERAARPNPRFDAATYECTLASAIEGEPQPSRHRRFLRRMGLFALETAREALQLSGARTGDRLGLFFGYGGLRAHWNDMMPALEHQQSDGKDAWERGFKLFHPFWMLQHLSNNAQALAAEELQARGEGVTFAGANAGAQAIAAAIRALEVDAIDAALVVAHDTLIEPETVVELAARGAATVKGHHELSAPYASNSAGVVPGEAAAALVLQRPERGSQVLSLVEAADAADGQEHEPRADAIARVLGSLARGNEVIDGAGRARPDLDSAERAAIASSVRPDAPLCCSLSAFGDLGAASSLVQVVALSELLRRGVLPSIAGLREAAAGPLRPLTQPESTSCRAAMAVSTGAPGLVGAVRVELP